jgi:hypothetical protein
MSRSRRHAIPRLLHVLVISALLAVCATASIASAATSSSAGLGGTWSGTYSGSHRGTFTIRWRQVHGSLRGSIALSSPHGTYSINGTVNRNHISFGAVGVGATYSGSVSPSGTSMSGHWKSGDGGSGSWSAHKTS